MNSVITDKAQLQSRRVDVESRSMRDNLIFYSIQEQQNENCDTVIKMFCNEKLHIEATNITLDRAHRMGPDSSKKPRPLVAKLHYYHERERIRNQGYEHRDTLRLTNQGVGIQRPKAVRDARKALYPIMQRERAKGNQVRLTNDQLYINGSRYRGPEPEPLTST